MSKTSKGKYMNVKKIYLRLRWQLLPWIIKPYFYLFVLIFWQPFIWKLIKPKDGTIDYHSSWHLKHAVHCLNKVRGDGWVITRIFGILVRDPYAHPQKDVWKYSRHHLFVIRR